MSIDILSPVKLLRNKYLTFVDKIRKKQCYDIDRQCSKVMKPVALYVLFLDMNQLSVAISSSWSRPEYCLINQIRSLIIWGLTELIRLMALPIFQIGYCIMIIDSGSYAVHSRKFARILGGGLGQVRQGLMDGRIACGKTVFADEPITSARNRIEIPQSFCVANVVIPHKNAAVFLF